MKTLTTADDFGFTENTNRAIIEAYEKGRITELSLMVDCYGSMNAVNYIKNNSVQNVGLHFSLCRISKDGKVLRGKDYDDILLNWTPEQLIAAFEEEVRLFEQLIGFTPKHIIGHKQISLNSKIVRYIADYCVRNICYARRGERSNTLGHFTLKADETPKGLNIGRTADAILGFRYGFPKDIYTAYKQDLAFLKQLGQIKSIEIFFHPGYSTDFEKGLTSFIQERLDDVNFLLSDYFLSLVEEENLQLVPSCEI
ncbi:MAG: hopanoid biosynthesis associated protein HpnK [Microgenomates group bacterium Gr01-1014_16]|nr:MAG: hopanoid biosynthesis associated protein HpnK [Microgenomates group bacterium Gr01-1014_16]